MIRIEESGTPVDALADALEVLDDTEALARAMAATASELVRSTFSATRSPDGLPWRPVVRPRAGIGGALLLSGDLRDEASQAFPDAYGFVLLVESVKGVHQKGLRKRNLPARPFYPVATSLPASWEEALGAAALRSLQARLP